jgi:hypothetical protein
MEDGELIATVGDKGEGGRCLIRAGWEDGFSALNK